MIVSDLKSMAVGWVAPQEQGLKPWRARIDDHTGRRGGEMDRIKSSKLNLKLRRPLSGQRRASGLLEKT